MGFRYLRSAWKTGGADRVNGGGQEEGEEYADSKCVPQRTAAFAVNLAQRKHTETYICSDGRREFYV